MLEECVRVKKKIAARLAKASLTEVKQRIASALLDV